MKELYRLLADAEPSTQNVIVTLLEEGDAYEKALISNGKMIWKSREEGFLAQKEAALIENTSTGIIEMDGKKIYCEAIGQEENLVICGGGHVSIPVIQIGKMLGFHVTVLEDRPTFADNARRAGADQVICDNFEDGLHQVEGSSHTYFVIVTRGHRYDQECLQQIAAKEHAYIGMIGSRRRTTMVKQILAEQGVDKEVLDQVYTPIGLDIGAETPAEIAVAIMGEIIEVKNRKVNGTGLSKKMLMTILDENEDHGGMVLLTIINRKGSAPRGVGSKMLIMRDGTSVGTIGGGCAEAEVSTTARRMLSDEKNKIRISHVDMTADEAEQEGMVCGGVIDVLLEVL